MYDVKNVLSVAAFENRNLKKVLFQIFNRSDKPKNILPTILNNIKAKLSEI